MPEPPFQKQQLRWRTESRKGSYRFSEAMRFPISKPLKYHLPESVIEYVLGSCAPASVK